MVGVPVGQRQRRFSPAVQRGAATLDGRPGRLGDAAHA
jgi:hypothetical protein